MLRAVPAALVLAVAAVFVTIAAIGIVRSRTSLAAIHAQGVASVVLGPLALVAVVIAVGFGVGAAKMLMVALVLLLGGPITAHAIAVAEHRRNPRA